MRAGPPLVAAVLFGVYLLAGSWTSQRIPTTGDEPFYFLAADALLHGEGLELTRRWHLVPCVDYTPGGDIAVEDFQLQTAPSLVRPGRYPLHDLGLSLFIAVPYALGGRALVLASLNLAMAIALALGARAALALGLSDRASLAAALAVGLSVPALTYSGLVYPDAIAPLLIAVALCALVRAVPRGLFGPSVALLPLLHLRYWPLAVMLLLLFAWLHRPSQGTLVVTLAPLALVLLGVSLVDLVTYGVPLPHAGFITFFAAGGTTGPNAYVPTTREGLIGLFIDRAFGLLPASPIAALFFVGAGMVARSRSRLELLVPLPYLVALSFTDWTGAVSPQSRYLAPLAPFSVMLLAHALSWRPAVLAALPLALWTFGQSLLYVRSPWLRYDAYARPPFVDGAWMDALGVRPSELFPLLGTDGATAALVVTWCLVLLGLAIAGLLAVRHGNVTSVDQTRVDA